ncbi:MAG: serpin family protein [Sedimentisphaerales bacterium]|nr:serpin family protein [Sedimentisphaerales bacterium]
MLRRRLINIVILAGLIAGGLLVVGLSSLIAEDAASMTDVNAVVAGNTEFAFDLYARLKEHPAVKEADGNLFFSPYSISTALAMTYAGAREDTARQMAAVLKFPSDTFLSGGLSATASPWEQGRLAGAFAALEKNLKAKPGEKGYELNVANALWGQKVYAFLPPFLDLNRKSYGAGLKEVDFAGATEQARRTINKWVEKETKDKIKELIRAGDLDPAAVLVLTNAIYFKGDWASKFKEENTKNATFHLSEEKTVETPMMCQKGSFDYVEDEDSQTLVLPYKGDELSMVVVLPKEVSLLASVESKLCAGNLRFELALVRKREVAVHLPKFKMTTATVDLGDILQSLGMKDAFSLPPADFSGMTGKKELFISNVLHKAFVEVNEEGTEAAAATAVVMAKGGPAMSPVFRADHPFIFIIRDNRSGGILFMGRVMNPVVESN